jgi:NAD(P)H-dependent FMN reductase
MSDLKIAIILGSTRPGRNGKAAADWVLENAASLTSPKYELVDLAHLRGICSELQMAHVRQQLSFSLLTDFENFSAFRPAERFEASAAVLFDQLETWAGALKTVREA